MNETLFAIIHGAVDLGAPVAILGLCVAIIHTLITRR